jgi:hypothetical protein
VVAFSPATALLVDADAMYATAQEASAPVTLEQRQGVAHSSWLTMKTDFLGAAYQSRSLPLSG